MFYIVDSIEANVETAATSVEQGSEQLRQARKHQVTLLCLSCLKIGDKTPLKLLPLVSVLQDC